MQKKTNSILALLTCGFIIFASFWCMSLPKNQMQAGLLQVFASGDGVIKLEPGSWNLEDENYGLDIDAEDHAPGVIGEQKVYVGNEGGLIGFLNRTVSFAILVIGSLSILGLIVGGLFLIIGSMKGNEEGINSGKDAVKYSLIGLAFVFLSYFIVSVVQTLLYS